MAHDRIAKEKAKKGCPECDGDVIRSTVERVPGGTDIEKISCKNCDWSQII